MLYLQKSPAFFRFISGFCLMSLAQTAAFGGVVPVYLPEPSQGQTLEVLSRGALGVLKTDQQVIVLPKAALFGTVTTFAPQGKNRDQVFGTLLTFGKPVLMSENDKDRWTNLFEIDQNYVAFDRQGFSWTVLDPKFKEILRRSIPRDLIRPPRDRGGEPTKPEIQSFRQAFNKEWNQTIPYKSSGIASAFSKATGTTAARSYFVALSLPKFPLALMECQKDEPSQCSLTRECYLEGARIPAAARAGVAVSEKRGLMIFGNRQEGTLLGYTFHSCFHSVHSHTWVLPKPLKRLTNLMIDAEERLWVTTEEPDDFHNASVYYWPKESW